MEDLICKFYGLRLSVKIKINGRFNLQILWNATTGSFRPPPAPLLVSP